MKKQVTILHIIEDQKFMPYCERTFALDFITNIYCSPSELKKGLPEHSIDVIIIHYLVDESVAFAASYQGKLPLLWFFWGADGFALGKFFNMFLLPETRQVRIKLAFKKSFMNGLRTILKSKFPGFIDKMAYSKQLLTAMSKIQKCIPVVPQDHQILSKYYAQIPPLFHLNYLSPIFDSNAYPTVNGDNVLLGNSAHFTNNHVEAIRILKSSNLGGRKIYIPLSYGNKGYADYVNKFAIQQFKDQAICLTDFLPFVQYQEIIQSCSIVVMNHMRQQALGNVIQALLMGCHIYLQEKNSLFQFLYENEFIISKIDKKLNLKSLSPEEKATNRRICLEVFGKDRQHQRVRQLLENVAFS